VRGPTPGVSGLRELNRAVRPFSLTAVRSNDAGNANHMKFQGLKGLLRGGKS